MEGEALRAEALPGAAIEDRAIPPRKKLTRSFWRGLVREARPAVLVLWLGPEDAATVEAAGAGTVRQLVFSSSLLQGTSPPVRDKVWLTWPYALPGKEDPLIYRVRAWMRSRGVERTDERLQLNAWFAMAIADHSLAHLVDNFSRDFFVESVEEETENALSPGVFPSLSLGPGQRFASKGSYVVRLTENGVEAVGEWVVP